MTEDNIWKIMALASQWGTARTHKRLAPLGLTEHINLSVDDAVERATEAEDELWNYLQMLLRDVDAQSNAPRPAPKMTTVWRSMYDAPKDGTIILAVLDSTYHKAPYPVFWDGFVWTLAWDGSSATPEAWTECPRMPTKAEMAIL